MSTEVSYKNLNMSLLSDNAMGLLSEFISTWCMNTGELIDLNSERAVVQVMQNAKYSKDRRLRSIYLHLRAEFSSIIQSSLTSCDAMLADQIVYHISKGRTCHLPKSEFVY